MGIEKPLELDDFDGWLDEVLTEILDNPPSSSKELKKIRRDASRKFKMKSPPGDAKLFLMLDDEMKIKLGPLLRRKPTRTLSGVAPVAIMTSPAYCPHGTCTYCPGGPKFGTAQSYTGYEPAARRAERNQFDASAQVLDRLNQYHAIGHNASKIDLIFMGGTFTSRSNNYRHDFVKGAFDAANGSISTNLNDAHNINEDSERRIIGLTIETRPDRCELDTVKWMLEIGTTRIELGIQCLDDNVLTSVNRGHSVQQGMDAAKRVRDAGLKVNLHLMPGLPGISRERDLEMLLEVMHGKSWRPDMLKIYPCLVVKGAALVEKWERGEFIPIRNDEAIELISEVLHRAPPWMRIQRIQRDIPAHEILDGVTAGNLRQLATRHLIKSGKRSGCIRDREIGRIENPPTIDKFNIVSRYFESADGEELFISFEAPHPTCSEEIEGFDGGVPVNTSNDIHKWEITDPPGGVIAGFLRLRLPSEDILNINSEGKTAIIREVKVFGKVVGVGESAEEDQKQHKGLGKLLVSEAEEKAKKLFSCDQIRVTAGVGVRRWFEKLGYSRKGPWMGKKLE